jgi:hypothetical protein
MRSAATIEKRCEHRTKYKPENINRKNYLEDPDVDGRMLLKYILRKYGMY